MIAKLVGNTLEGSTQDCMKCRAGIAVAMPCAFILNRVQVVEALTQDGQLSGGILVAKKYDSYPPLLVLSVSLRNQNISSPTTLS